MHPCARSPRDRDDFGEAIEVPGVYLAGLQEQDRTFVERRQPCGVNPSELVDRRDNELLRTETENAQSFLHGDMHRLRYDHPNLRRAREAVLVEIPPGAGE